MNLATLARFLLGSRSAILTLAASRWSLPLGALLVLSASLARNYDRVDLLSHPDVLLLGLVVSTINAFIFFSTLWVLTVPKTHRSPELRAPYWRTCFSFLALFWLTSPMAWLYGVPYEQFLSSLDAIQANALTLALVSLWRVLLISRVLSVLLRVRFAPTFFIVLAISLVLVVAAINAVEASLPAMMGGIDAGWSLDELAVASLTFEATIVIAFLLLLAAPSALIACAFIRPQPLEDFRPAHKHTTRTFIVFVAASVLIWAPGIAFFQPKLHRSEQVQRLVSTGRELDAFRMMAAHDKAAFPNRWQLVRTHALRMDAYSRFAALAQSQLSPPWVIDYLVAEINGLRLLPDPTDATLQQQDWEQSWVHSAFETWRDKDWQSRAKPCSPMYRFMAAHDPALSDGKRVSYLRIADVIDHNLPTVP